ncbi:MAG: hypothetical protein GY796_20090 [Chloroflexi bacterium]|nr:hypothetical protein [Chloroflexota bacterium]
MMQRIWALTRYFTQRLFRSLAGLLYVILTLAFWLLLFNPRQQTPDAAYYILVIGVFGAGMAFLVTLTISTRANQAENYPWLVRLPSRVEYMTAVFLSTLLVTFILQMGLALLALFNGPELTFSRLIEIPPIWTSLVIITAVLALHATDLISSGWSRVYLFGVLAIMLFAQGITNNNVRNILTSLNRFASNQGWLGTGEMIANYSATLNNNNSNIIGRLFSLLFWPFQAIAEATANGTFTTAQALAPAILLLYAAILYMLAADLFANKDLFFTE